MQSVEFETFVEQTTPSLLGRARALAADQHDAWDLVQETLVRIGERWDRLDDPAAYASTVMTRLNIDRIRRLRRDLGLRQRLTPLPSTPPSEDGPEAWLVDALHTLSPHQRTALALRFLDDLDVEGIATQLGCQPGTARSHLSRGMARLELRPHPDQGEFMSLDDDDALRSSYVTLARPTDPVEDPVGAVRRRIGQRGQRRRAVAAVATAAVVAVVGIGIHVSTETPSASSGAAGGSVAPSHGALPVPGAESCAVDYNHQTLGQSDWAADATVTKIGRGRTTVTVEFDVHRWYRGGTSQTLEVRMPSPRAQVEDAPPTYGIDTRLLLSGSGSDGTRVARTCGLTRYYDAKTAAVWAKVFTR